MVVKHKCVKESLNILMHFLLYNSTEGLVIAEWCQQAPSSNDLWQDIISKWLPPVIHDTNCQQQVFNHGAQKLTNWIIYSFGFCTGDHQHLFPQWKELHLWCLRLWKAMICIPWNQSNHCSITCSPSPAFALFCLHMDMEFTEKRSQYYVWKQSTFD